MLLYLHSSRSLKQHPEGIGLSGWPRLSDFLSTSLSEISLCCAAFLPTACLLLSLISPFCITFLFVCSLLLFFFYHFHMVTSSLPRQELCFGSVYLQCSINRVNFWLCFCQRCALFTQLMTFSLKINERFIQFCNLLITWPEVEKTWALGDLYRQQIKFSSTNNSWTWTSSSALVLFWKEQQGVHSSSEPLSITRSMASRTGGRLGS